jgi:hypothetical protein
MVNVIDRKCLCSKAQPTFNVPNSKKAICCQSCKTADMIDFKNIVKLCVTCKKFRANYNIESETKGKYCKNCAPDNTYDVTHKKCLGQNGVCSLKQRGSPKYKDYCSACYSQNFPLDVLTFQIRSKTKVIAVRDFINSKFEGFQHDEPMWTGACDCTIRRRLDHRKLIGNTILAIETDEFGHRGYDKIDEEIRYDDVYMIHSGKWIFIRFNPDTNVSKIDIQDKLDKLVETMNEYIYKIEQEENIELIEIIKLYC